MQYVCNLCILKPVGKIQPSPLREVLHPRHRPPVRLHYVHHGVECRSMKNVQNEGIMEQLGLNIRLMFHDLKHSMDFKTYTLHEAQDKFYYFTRNKDLHNQADDTTRTSV